MRIVDGGLTANTEVALGIDQSYTGFAVTAMAIKGNAVYRSYLFKGDGNGASRLAHLRSLLWAIDEDLTNRYCPYTAAAMEGYAPGAKFGRELAGELGGMTKLWLHDRSIEPVIVPPTRLKKFVTGKGTGVPKNMMLLHTFKKWGVEFDDDNLADSYGLARLVTGRHELAYEKEIYDKLR